jgi:hypothetical protein
LESWDDLVAVFRELAWAQVVWGSAFWMFDFARPKADHTCRDYSRIFLRGAPDLHHDTTDRALRAAWTPEELREAARRAGLRVDGGGPSRVMPLFQSLWAGPLRGPELSSTSADAIPEGARANVRLLQLLMAGRGPQR